MTNSEVNYSKEGYYSITAKRNSDFVHPNLWKSSSVSPEPSLLAHTSSESRGTFRQKARSLAPLNGCACAVKICHDGMLEDTNLLDGAHMLFVVHTFLPNCFVAVYLLPQD